MEEKKRGVVRPHFHSITKRLAKKTIVMTRQQPMCTKMITQEGFLDTFTSEKRASDTRVMEKIKEDIARLGYCSHQHTNRDQETIKDANDPMMQDIDHTYGHTLLHRDSSSLSPMSRFVTVLVRVDVWRARVGRAGRAISSPVLVFTFALSYPS